mmetsp:Transcript_78680/g.218505  ORF Transcript_78680/g.218505 Transcript_78680/m.218505 type:complete len:299 (+) Transcript_78680:85-981(+)
MGRSNSMPVREEVVQANDSDAPKKDACVTNSSQPSTRKRTTTDMAKEFLAIDLALEECCRGPNPKARVTAYTHVYNLCSRKHGTEIKEAVYEKFSSEMRHCVEELEASIRNALRRFESAPSTVGDFSQVASAWRRLARRFGVVEATFRYLDRYYVPTKKVAPLKSVRLSLLSDAALEEVAEGLFKSVILVIRDGTMHISAEAVRDFVAAWLDLVAASGLQVGAVNVLREHLVVVLSKGGDALVGVRRATIAWNATRSAANGLANGHILQLQTPLVRLIVEHLSEQDLHEVYSLRNLSA